MRKPIVAIVTLSMVTTSLMLTEPAHARSNGWVPAAIVGGAVLLGAIIANGAKHRPEQRLGQKKGKAGTSVVQSESRHSKIKTAKKAPSEQEPIENTQAIKAKENIAADSKKAGLKNGIIAGAAVAVGLVGAEAVASALAHQPNLPSRDKVPPKQIPEPDHFKTVQLSPSEAAVQQIAGAVFSSRASQPPGATAIVKQSIDLIYTSSPLAKLEQLPESGWTRDVLRQRLLEAMRLYAQQHQEEWSGVGEQSPDLVVNRVGALVLPSLLETILLEQEASAFTASLKRYSAAAADTRVKVAATVGAGADDGFANLEAGLVGIDREIERRNWGLRGKLRARSILLDCLSEAKPEVVNASITSGAATLDSGRSEASNCDQRLWAYFGGVVKLDPVPTGLIWTYNGPTLHGKAWNFSFNEG